MRKKNQGGHALEGNQARKFLKRVDSLELALRKESSMAMVEGLPYITTFRAFNKVVVACFGMELAPDYKDHIAKFSQLYRELDISVTPKVDYILLSYTEYQANLTFI